MFLDQIQIHHSARYRLGVRFGFGGVCQLFAHKHFLWVQGLGFGVQGLGHGEKGLGFRVQGLGFWGFGVLGFWGFGF